MIKEIIDFLNGFWNNTLSWFNHNMNSTLDFSKILTSNQRFLFTFFLWTIIAIIGSLYFDKYKLRHFKFIGRIFRIKELEEKK